jgi:parallel beta-helix repeat protein
LICKVRVERTMEIMPVPCGRVKPLSPLAYENRHNPEKNLIALAVTALALMFRGGAHSQASPLISYEAAVLATPGLISFYKCDGTANDDFGANDGTLKGTASFVTGIGGGPDQTLSFDGSVDCMVAFGLVPAFDFANGNGTVELWVQAGAIVGNGCLLASRDTSGARYSIYMNENGQLIDFNDVSGAQFEPLPEAEGTKWHHLAVVFESNYWSAVWDGQSLGFTNANGLGSLSVRHPVQLGNGYEGDNEGFTGNLDQIAFYSNALPLSVIQAHYEAYMTNFYASNLMVLPVGLFGAVAHGSGDSGPAIRQAIQTAIQLGSNRVVTFQPGAYNMSPDGTTGYCLNMAYANGLSLQGSGTTLIVTNPLTGGLSWKCCTNSSVSGITIDYNPLPFTQGTITAINKSVGTFNVTLDAGYALLSESLFTNPIMTGEIIDPILLRPKAGTDDLIALNAFSLVSGTTYRLTPTDPNVVSQQIAVNDRFVYMARSGGWDLAFDTCTNSLVQDVTVNTGPCGGMVAVNGYGIVASNWSVSVPAGSGRLLAAPGGVMFQNVRGGIVLADCYMESMADDGVNIHCVPNPVLQVASSTSITVGVNTPMQTGDRVQVFDIATGTIRGETTVTGITLMPLNTYQLTLAAPIPGMVAGAGLTNSDSLFDLSASGEGYLLTNNVINGNRARGILLRSGNGLVVSNTITGSSMDGIQNS